MIIARKFRISPIHPSSWASWSFQCSQLLLLKSFKVSKSCLKLSFIEIQIFNYSNLVKWKYDQNKSCTYWWVLQLWYSQVFHLKSFTLLKYYFKLKLFEFQNLNHSNKVTWQDDQNKSYTCWWVIQLLCLQHFHFRSFNVLKL